MSDGAGDGGAGDGGTDPLRLRGAQRAIRDAYVAADAGLFTLDCVPGAGKSVVAHHVAAEDILRRYAAGDPTPEQHVAVVSFNRDEAADIVPAICDRLQAIVEHDLVPAAADISEAELRYLRQRTRQAPYAGTVDGFLRGIFGEFAGEIGFDETPTVGNDALLKRVHRDCYESLREEPEHAQRLRDLEAAYPDGEYDAGVDEMLSAALTYCRDRRLSTEAFRTELERTRDSAYPGGKPDSFADIVRSVERFVGGEDAGSGGDDEPEGDGAGDGVAGNDRAGDRVREVVTDSDRARLLDADRELFDAWNARIDDFCAVLSAYRARYRDAIREYGAVSHTDVAYLVDAYFDGSDSRPDLPTPLRSVDDAHRDRVRRTYRSRIRSLIIDEAQDVSAVQHAALSHVVTSDSRVFACGDVFQGIYLWRHADPGLFAAATTEGTYLGVDWDTHENRTATTTYRCVPDVAAAINAVAEPVFTDPARGALGDLDASYSRLDAARDGGDEPGVHVSTFAGVGRPGSAAWANPDGATGEANMLARHVSRGLTDGTFCDDDGDPLGVTVLFRRGTRMPEYEAAFGAEGLRVRTATDALFDCPAVETALAVCEWLIAPGSPRRTAELLTESPLSPAFDAAPFEARSWDLDRVLDDDPTALGESQRSVLSGLVRLRDRSDAFDRLRASVYVEDVIEALALRADANDCVDGADDPDQRVANLDALVETLSEWESDGRYPPSELIDLVDPFREDPGAGPAQPSATGAAYDVEFRTIHRAKGDEDDVVVVADPGFDIWSRGPHVQRFVAQGPIAGLAPPTNTAVPDDIPVPPFDGGLYGAGDGWGRDVGLRWATARWRDSTDGSADRGALVGPERLRRVAENERAEAWRLLYVALTRARDHLVVPLPRSAREGDRTRDRWLDALRDGLAFPKDGADSFEMRLDATPNRDPDRDAIEVGVNDVDLFARRGGAAPRTGRDRVAESPPRRDRLAPWIPRFLSPSTMYPLTEDADRYALAHLLGEPLHTTTNEVPGDLPLRFDRLGPEEVGTCLHDALTNLVARDLDDRAIRPADSEIRAAFDAAANALPKPVGEGERAGMLAFFETVVDDFLDSDLWERIADPATAVSVERPLDGLADVGDIEVEIHGRADFVVEHPNGERFVTDVKISLTQPTSETRRRYELQIAAYAFLAEQTDASNARVRRTVETFGVARETTTASWPADIVHRRLRRFLDR